MGMTMPITDVGELASGLFTPLRGAGLTMRGRSDHPLIWAAYGGKLAQRPSVIPAATTAPPQSAPASRDVLARTVTVFAGVAVAAVVTVVVGGTVTAGGPGRLWAAAITGLTAGGLSCLAVQGGLLAAATKADTAIAPSDQARRILAFLTAKLIAYTLLGALLGLFGAAVQPSPVARGVVQAIIGLFMIGTGVQMARPNCWTRRLVLEPPPNIRRWLRERARRGADLSDAAVLGGLTVLIPCGVTQAMMAGAMALGTPIGGALLMAAFTLGTWPVFFALAYGASSLGLHARTYFNAAVAVLLLVMGFVAIQTGFALAGHPLPIRPILAASSDSTPATQATQKEGAQQAVIQVANDSYTPTNVRATAGMPLQLVFATSEVTGCTRTVVVPVLHIEKVLPATGTETIEVPAQKAGSKLRWVCGMGMYSGSVTFE